MSISAILGLFHHDCLSYDINEGHGGVYHKKTHDNQLITLSICSQNHPTHGLNSVTDDQIGFPPVALNGETISDVAP
jgi:hypothetical protein